MARVAAAPQLGAIAGTISNERFALAGDKLGFVPGADDQWRGIGLLPVMLGFPPHRASALVERNRELLVWPVADNDQQIIPDDWRTSGPMSMVVGEIAAPNDLS